MENPILFLLRFLRPDMNRSNFNELGCFITIYFGQDYDLIDDSDEIEPKIDAFLRNEHPASWQGLAADIDLFLSESSDPETTFEAYFQDEFDPHLWGTTTVDFLHRVRTKLSKALAEQSDQLS